MSCKERKLSPIFAIFIILSLTTTGCGLLNQLKARDHLNKGVNAYSGQRYKLAVEEFTKAVSLDPELLNARLYLATAYRSQWTPGVYTDENAAKADKAISTFEEVLEKDPENVNAMANIAGIYNANDEPEKAKEWYRKRLIIDPENPEPYYGIGTINWKLSHDETGMNGDGVEFLEEEDRAKIDTVVTEGIEALEKALELDDDYTDAMQYLNLMYRERSYLAEEEDEKRRWEIEAGRLALKAMDSARRRQKEEEIARHSFASKEENE